MRHVNTARLTPTGLGEEGDLLLAASRSRQALALPVHSWPASDTRTAEYHLSKVFTRLGITSRGQLERVLT
jgi:hypothetical protein